MPDCYCGGRYPDWEYHTPTGCATTLEKLEAAQERFRKRGGLL